MAKPRAKHLFIYTDGASRGNPGDASIGVVIKNDRHEIIETVSQYLGIATNNKAEYIALIRALEEAKKFHPIAVNFYLDSQLVVRQITGQYKVKDAGLIPLHRQAKTLYGQYEQASISHIPREENNEADALANEALDKQKIKGII
ncbi:MAG: ribonuclease HI family protein [Nitrospirae bacterium]|nr:ribonuclease HI family protein [Candidatus Troglogloeales bacterium]